MYIHREREAEPVQLLGDPDDHPGKQPPHRDALGLIAIVVVVVVVVGSNSSR